MSRNPITCAAHPDLYVHLSNIAVAEFVELRVPYRGPVLWRSHKSPPVLIDPSSPHSNSTEPFVPLILFA